VFAKLNILKMNVTKQRCQVRGLQVSTGDQHGTKVGNGVANHEESENMDYRSAGEHGSPPGGPVTREEAPATEDRIGRRKSFIPPMGKYLRQRSGFK
jgi:hypothetical protein